MKLRVFITCIVVAWLFTAGLALAAYEHEGESDSDNFLAVYPAKAQGKLDHCALCHSGGQKEKRSGTITLGSCQWCHETYGYDGSGNIVDTLNPYGMAYLTNGRNQAAITAIDGLDSDDDTYSNADEIAAERYPGNAEDDPTKVEAPSRVYTKAQLQALPSHTQFLLMNSSRGGTTGLDSYDEYKGVTLETLLEDAGIQDTATGITVFAADGWSQYHPLTETAGEEIYHVYGTYPQASYYYDAEADAALNPDTGWCDYRAPACQGRSPNDPIIIRGGLQAMLAYEHNGTALDPGYLDDGNSLEGEGPYRVVVPQKNPGPPDQASSDTADQNVKWPYDDTADHNAGASSRTVTIIRVEPLPEGTTDIDIYEAGWDYVDSEKIVIYGAIEPSSDGTDGNGSGGGGSDGGSGAAGCFVQTLSGSADFTNR